MNEYLHIKDIKIPLYRGRFVVILTNSKTKLKKYLPKFEQESIYAHSWVAEYKSKQGYIMVLNFNNETTKITNGTITHEVVHIADFIADDKGFIADFHNDEPIAYLAGWITDEVYNFINKHKFKVA